MPGPASCRAMKCLLLADRERIRPVLAAISPQRRWAVTRVMIAGGGGPGRSAARAAARRSVPR